MPAKKTFSSIRVRGPAEMRVAPTIEGQPLVDYVSERLPGGGVGGGGTLRYRARVSVDGDGVATAIEPLNSLGVGVSWEHVGDGQWRMVVSGDVAWDRAIGWAGWLVIEDKPLGGGFVFDGEGAPLLVVWDLTAVQWWGHPFDGLNVFIDVVPE